MGYNNLKIPKSGFLSMVKTKLGKLLAKSAPLNSLRIMGIKLCGFTVGKNVYVGEDLLIITPNSEKTCNLIIEDRVAIAPRVTIVLASDANWSKLMDDIKPIRGTVHIKCDAWIGTGAIILPNCIIEPLSIIAAGAVVTRNVKYKTIVSGVPAKTLKKYD